MKFTLPNLQLGQVVRAQLIEKTSSGEWIANFNGDLVRVANQSQKPLKSSQWVELKVVSVNPLSFQIFERHSIHGRQWSV